MTSTKRQKELARARAQRQAQRRQAGRRRQRNQQIAVVVTLVAIFALVGVIALVAGGSTKKSPSALSATPGVTPTAATTATACGGVTPPAPRTLTYPKEPALTVDAKKHYTMTLTTSCGQIAFSMDAAKAPHTVNALTFLAGKGYYDGTFCHRMTTGASLTVLQCGDPTGTGSGGPGFTIAEENLTGAKYLRGYVAMAKTSAPHSTASQFFLIDKDSQLPPDYTIVGQMTPAGLKVLDKILAIGQDNANGAGDGAPKEKVYILTARVTSS